MTGEAVARQMQVPIVPGLIDLGPNAETEYKTPEVVTGSKVAADFGFETLGQPAKNSQVYLPEQNAAMREAAEKHVADIMAAAKGDLKTQQNAQMKLETIGLAIQQEAAAMTSEIFETRIKDFSTRLQKGKGSEGEELANDLLTLRDKVEGLDPTELDLKPGFLSRFAKAIPIIGTPMSRYISKYQSAQTVMQATFDSLAKGGEKMLRNSEIARGMQLHMRECMTKLENVIGMAQLMQRSLKAKIDALPQDGEEAKFLKQEVLFSLQQRITDLQQQLAVNQQGILTMAVIIGNNRELIRAVNQTMTVTRNALGISVATAIFLNDQAVVLAKIKGINEVTVKMMARNAKRLKQEGVVIQQQASGLALDMKTLEMCYQDIIGAMDDLANFREKAIVEQADNIIKLNELNGKARESIIKMEKGDKAKQAMGLGA